MMKIQNNESNRKKCICGNCPSYSQCMRGGREVLYCANKKSGCDFKRMGCICGSCPVHKENKLKSGYYCNSDARE